MVRPRSAYVFKERISDNKLPADAAEITRTLSAERLNVAGGEFLH